MLWRHDGGPAPKTADEPLRFRRLEFGPAARLWAEERIAAIEPAESQALLAAASPFDADGNLRGLTVETREAREDYIVRAAPGDRVAAIAVHPAIELRRLAT